MTMAVEIVHLIVAISLLGASGQLSPPAESEASETRGAPAPAPVGKDCLLSLLNVSDCLSYVEVGSNETNPDKACCPELAGLLESSPKCLCYLLGMSSTKQYKIKLDRNKALKLPSACGILTPHPSSCSVLGIPMAAPSESPGAQPQEGLANTTSESNGNHTICMACSVWALLFGPILFLLDVSSF